MVRTPSRDRAALLKLQGWPAPLLELLAGLKETKGPGPAGGLEV